MKRLTIITINYNNRDGLRKTIESVVNQTTRQYEYIVIDGGSTDGSKEVIEEYSDRIDYWVSEPDKGIYNAMNKGVRAATCEFCQFLNSGDVLADKEVLKKIIPHLNSDVDILSGFTIVDNEGKLVRREKNSPEYMTKHFIIGCFLSHPSSFIRKQLLIDYPYKENYKIISDWSFFVEVFTAEKAIYQHIDLDVVIFDANGISSINNTLVENERRIFLDDIKVSSIIDEMAIVPFELYTTYKKIPYSDSLKDKLNILINGIICCYLTIRGMRNIKNIENTMNREPIKHINR